jgi:hypothetical protein
MIVAFAKQVTQYSCSADVRGRLRMTDDISSSLCDRGNEIVVQEWTGCLHAGQRAPSTEYRPNAVSISVGAEGQTYRSDPAQDHRHKEIETENRLYQAVHQAIEVTRDRVDATSSFDTILDSHDVDSGAEHYSGNSDSRESPRVSGLITFHGRRLRPSDPRRSFARRTP